MCQQPADFYKLYMVAVKKSGRFLRYRVGKNIFTPCFTIIVNGKKAAYILARLFSQHHWVTARIKTTLQKIQEAQLSQRKRATRYVS